MTRKIATTPTLVEQLSEQRRRVDFDSYDITVQQLMSMVSQQLIDVAPTYQRRFRWDAARQSQLIESIFLGIPVPNLFMATNANATWEVVDGVQRLSTLVHFAGDDQARNMLKLGDQLRIEKLEKLSTLNGKLFGELPQTIQLQFALRPVKVTTLNDKSDLEVRFDLFERLNTGGVRLTAHEIRGCIYRGRFKDYLERLSNNDNFKKVVVLRDSMEKDGTREEFVLRFFAFLHRYQDFDRSVVKFLNTYMADASRSFEYKASEALFNQTFDELARIFPNGIHRRLRTTPVNLYEAVSVGAAIALNKRGRLKGTAADVARWIDSKELRSMTSAGTNNGRMVVGRIEYAARQFGGL